MKDIAQAAHEKLVEMIAEGNDALMEEFFDKGTIPEEHLIPALHDAIREDKIFPVLFASGLGNISTDRLMDFIVEFTPQRPSMKPSAARSLPATASPRSARSGFRAGSLYVFKTVSDPFAAAFHTSKVFSGLLKNDTSPAKLHPQHARKAGGTFPSCRGRPLCP